MLQLTGNVANWSLLMLQEIQPSSRSLPMRRWLECLPCE